jgi:arylsulfatase A-like enzyme
LAALSGCGAPPAEKPRPNVILISLDTVRRDAVGVYGSVESARTPEIDRFAETSVRFDQAWAPVPYTLPSHMSLFTGLHPVTHGVAGRDHVLSKEIPTLGELAASGGYRTIGLVSNIWMKGHFGFDRGFDHYERVRFGLSYADRINKRLFELLDRAGDADRPLFAFLHYIDAHSDYDKAGSNLLPYYAPPERLAEIGLSPESTEFCDDEGNCGTGFLTAANKTGRPIDPDVIERLHDLYRIGVEALDHEIGALLDGLERRDLLDSSIVVITSDHGEEFREHGRFVHAQPYAESLAVPLLVRFPGGAHAGTVVDDPVELADLMPSLVTAMGLEVPSHVPSRDLFSPIASGDGLSHSRILGVDKNRKKRFALRDGSSTFIHDLATSEIELYDRSTDPGEIVNLVGTEPDRAAELDAHLAEMLAAYAELGRDLGAGNGQAGADVLTDEEQDQLRAIGYLD